MTESNSLYLGRTVNDRNDVTGQDVAYPLEHLTTHALLLGTTGSGKTGLGLVLVEEALRKRIPVLLLDVKGDLANLLLTFPDQSPDDFAPWIDADAARRRGQSPDQAAAATARHWREGLAEWGLRPADVAHLRTGVDIALYTPGLRAGRPVDVLARFSAPASGDPDAAVMRAQGLTSALLDLAGIDADPLHSREHILLTTLMRHAWETQGTLDIPTLIQQVQQPPVERIGVFDMESFFPQKARFELALTLNNLIAAPGFARWREGEPLDIDHFLTAPNGHPRASVFYLAHLPEEQRHFFVTLFLEELRAWVRRQPGTRTLRALLFFDEVFGHLPPHPHNPATKAPLMALVKQGRAAGLGVALSTQNPADLDYKGLGNIGTWFVGSLRTDRDKTRVLEGMEGAVAEAGLKSSAVEAALSRLKPRVFLMHDAREGALTFFHSRWAMSYLRGPLTPAEAQQLATPQPVPDFAGVSFAAPTSTATFTTQPPNHLAHQPPAAAQHPHRTPHPPIIDPSIPQAYLPATMTAAWALRNHVPPLPVDTPATLIYRPYLVGAGTVHIFNTTANIALADDQVWRVDPLVEGSWNRHWDQGEMIDLQLTDLEPQFSGDGYFEQLPPGIGSAAAHARRESALKTHLYHHGQITLWACKSLKLYSQPGESKRAFLDRCREEAEKRKSAELALERRTFEEKAARVEAKIRKEEMELDEDREVLSERRREELLSGAESVLSLFSRRRRTSRALSQTSRQRRYVKTAKADVEESVKMLEMYDEELDQIEAAWQAAAADITARWDGTLSDIQENVIRAKRTDIDVRFCGIVWFPFWEVDLGAQPLLLPAYIV